MQLAPISKSAFKLFLEGTIALAQCETWGIRIDAHLLQTTIDEAKRQISELQYELYQTDVWKVWQKMFGEKANIGSGMQGGQVLFSNIKEPKYGNLGYECLEFTEHGSPSFSADSLVLVDNPFVKPYLEFLSVTKTLNTFLYGIQRELDVNNRIHPSFDLNTVQTYRSSCLAKGTLISIWFENKRVYIPIENVKKNDFVFCFDDNNTLCKRRVLWSGKTGNRKIVRIHFSCIEDGSVFYEYLDCTPDHKIRLISGEYVEAQYILEYKDCVLFEIDYLSDCCYEIQKVEELENTIDVYDLEIEEFHNFIANSICVHNSSNPNFQNFPNRSGNLAKMVRSVFIPDKGCHFVEIDYSGAEVRASCAICGDPNLKRYVVEGHGDMHKDMAAQCFIIPVDEVTKELRSIAKGKFVFASFYGSYWKGLAAGLWDSIKSGDVKTKDGISILNHLATKGITELGDIDSEGKPSENSYFSYIKSVEKDFWENRFPVYNQWKKDTYNEYVQTGYIDLPSGFRMSGVFGRNKILNAPAQSLSFHCLLWSLIQIVNKALKKYNLRTKVLGQIHDSIVASVYSDELDDYLEIAKFLMTEQVTKHFKIFKEAGVPMEIEVECSDVDCSWYDKKYYSIAHL
jgi:hypothetical protein